MKEVDYTPSQLHTRQAMSLERQVLKEKHPTLAIADKWPSTRLHSRPHGSTEQLVDLISLKIWHAGKRLTSFRPTSSAHGARDEGKSKAQHKLTMRSNHRSCGYFSSLSVIRYEEITAIWYAGNTRRASDSAESTTARRSQSRSHARKKFWLLLLQLQAAC